MAVAVGAQQDFALVSSGPPARIALRAVDDSAKAGTSESFAARTVDAFGSDLGETRDVTLTIDDRPCGGDSCRIAAPGPHVVSAVSGHLVGSAVITAQH